MKFPEKFRFQNPGSAFHSTAADPGGMFIVPAQEAKGRTLQIIACDFIPGSKWQHVSVSIPGTTTTPTWEEMCFVKSLFWDPSECVVQFHPPEKDYVNVHPGVLHLWRFQERFAMPPKILV